MELLFFTLLAFVTTVYLIASCWRIFNKAGQFGFAAIIPVYNTIILLKIIEKPWWWFFLFLVPILNIVLLIIASHRLSKCFGQEVGFTLGIIFLPIIFYPLIGFGDYAYGTEEKLSI